MDGLFRPPEPPVFYGTIEENWKRFSQKFDVFLEVTDLKSKPAAEQVAVFLNLVEDVGLDLVIDKWQ